MVGGTAAALAVMIGPSWFRALVPEHRVRAAALVLLGAAEPAYVASLLILLAGGIGGVSLVVRARRRGRPAPIVARGLLLVGGLLVGVVLVELASGAWRAWAHRLPALPDRYEVDDPATLDVAIIGGSSAYGLPFERWLSTGRIVAWKLGEVFPDRPVRLDVLAEPGVALEQMHAKLARQRRRPDVLLIYSGHNEFSYRYRWSRSVPYYDDDRPPASPWQLVRGWAERCSPLCALIREAVEANGLGDPPLPDVTRSLVDVPVFTPEEYRERLDDFRRRLDAIVAHCDRVGTLAVVIVPPGNDAGFEPNRSMLPASTPWSARESFARRFEQVRRSEAEDPGQAIAGYRELLARGPSFAEAHYRLARLLAATDRQAEAAPHFRAARDLDGLPMRCPTAFQSACREVVARHPGAILIDGEAAIARASPDGLLGDRFFLDAMHPGVRGHARLAEAVLDGLRERAALGWPDGTPSPTVETAACAEHFGLGREGWIVASDWGATFFERTAYIRYDPADRLSRIQRYRAASRALADGADPDEVGIPGLGAR